MHFDRFDPNDPTRCVFAESLSPLDRDYVSPGELEEQSRAKIAQQPQDDHGNYDGSSSCGIVDGRVDTDADDEDEDDDEFTIHDNDDDDDDNDDEDETDSEDDYDEYVYPSARMRNRLKYSEWRADVENYLDADPEAQAQGGGFGNPAHTIRVKTTVNDTEPPGMVPDFDNHEVSFRWRDILVCLFREDGVRFDKMRQWAQSPSTLKPGTNVELAMFERMTSGYTNKLRSIRKQLRRQRIRDYYKADHDIDWDMDTMDTNDESVSLNRIDFVEEGLDWIDFAEDSNDMRADRQADAEWEAKNIVKKG